MPCWTLVLVTGWPSTPTPAESLGWQLIDNEETRLTARVQAQFNIYAGTVSLDGQEKARSCDCWGRNCRSSFRFTLAFYAPIGS
jgi:hypothetical protein